VDWEEVTRRALDVQYQRPDIELGIQSAGIGGLRIPLSGISSGPVRFTEGSVDAFVDLPPGMRGVNMSRSVRAILESAEGARSVEGLASAAVERLLKLHEYSSSSRVIVRAAAFADDGPAGGPKSPERFLVIADFRSMRGSGTSGSLGVSVNGITACPCGAELMRSALGGCGVCATHMQRASVLLAARPAASTTILGLRSAALRAMSGEVHALLRRSDEAAVIHAALSNTRFAEDVFRHAALLFAEDHPLFPEDGELRIRVRSNESIHGHDVVVDGVLSGEDLLTIRLSS
jgi:GTP cyclohydrolase FolE2